MWRVEGSHCRIMAGVSCRARLRRAGHPLFRIVRTWAMPERIESARPGSANLCQPRDDLRCPRRARLAQTTGLRQWTANGNNGVLARPNGNAAIVLYGPCAVRSGAVIMPRPDRWPCHSLRSSEPGTKGSWVTAWNFHQKIHRRNCTHFRLLTPTLTILNMSGFAIRRVIALCCSVPKRQEDRATRSRHFWPGNRDRRTAQRRLAAGDWHFDFSLTPQRLPIAVAEIRRG